MFSEVFFFFFVWNVKMIISVLYMNEIIEHVFVPRRPECPKLFFSPSTSLTSDHPQVLSDQTKRLFWHRCWLVESEPDILSVKLMSTQRGRKWATKSIEGRSMVTLWLFILVLRKVRKNFCHGYRGSVSVCGGGNLMSNTWLY